MRSGLLAYFGDASRPHAKWLSLARVLADSSCAGASYVDVRLPERPAAGFPPGVAPPASAGSQTEQANSAESTVAALAAGLSGSGGGASGEASSQGLGDALAVRLRSRLIHPGGRRLGGTRGSLGRGARGWGLTDSSST